MALIALAACGGRDGGGSGSTGGRHAAGSSAARQPNVVVVVLDALRWDRLGVNGDPRSLTPCIDGLAEEGVSLEAFASSTWTKPSVASLFTSLYPTQHGIWRVGVESEGSLRAEILRTRWTTLAEYFQAAGWATGAAVNQVHLSPRFHFDQGFDRYDWVRGKDAFELNQLFLRWLEEEVVPGDRPFFGYVHALDPHWPYSRFLPGEHPPASEVELPEGVPRVGRLLEEWILDNDAAEVLRRLRRRYDLEVAFADRAICELVDGLRNLDLWRDTVLVVTSDHGEGFGERGKLQHGYLPYDELMRVPMVVRLPEDRPRPVGRPRVALIDLLPTLLELAGLPPAEHAQGFSFAPALSVAAARMRVHFSETATGRAVRSRDGKLIRRFDGTLEFYDLAADPGETRPLPCEGECEELVARLDAFEGRMRATRDQRPETVAIDPEDIELLEALGYL